MNVINNAIGLLIIGDGSRLTDRGGNRNTAAYIIRYVNRVHPRAKITGRRGDLIIGIGAPLIIVWRSSSAGQGRNATIAVSMAIFSTSSSRRIAIPFDGLSISIVAPGSGDTIACVIKSGRFADNLRINSSSANLSAFRIFNSENSNT